jgi:hypothetical protein
MCQPISKEKKYTQWLLKNKKNKTLCFSSQKLPGYPLLLPLPPLYFQNYKDKLIGSGKPIKNK